MKSTVTLAGLAVFLAAATAGATEHLDQAAVIPFDPVTSGYVEVNSQF